MIYPNKFSEFLPESFKTYSIATVNLWATRGSLFIVVPHISNTVIKQICNKPYKADAGLIEKEASS